LTDPIELWVVTLSSVALLSLLSFVGLLALARNRSGLDALIPHLVALAAGSLLGTALLHVLPRAIDELGTGLPLFLLLTGSFVAFFALEKFLWTHHHGEELEEHDHGPKPVVLMNLIGDGLHNFVDGIMIAASFQVDLSVGAAATLAVAIHEIPQEIGDFGVLIHGGLSVKRALFLNFLSATMAILGAVVSLAVGAESQTFVAYLLPVAAANFLYIAAADLIPELHRERGGRKALIQVALVILGVLLMLAVRLLAE
jgi:zinc and cadmium transporter